MASTVRARAVCRTDADMGTKPRGICQLAGVGLSTNILNYDQPESLALLPSERRLPPFPRDFGLDMRGCERRGAPRPSQPDG